MKSSSMTLSVLALLTLTLPAASQDYRVTGQYAFWVGEFAGIFFNDKGANSLFDHAGIRCPGSFDLNFGKKQSHGNGYCVIMADGSTTDQAFLKWSCDGDTIDCVGTFEYTAGTGKYQSANGSNTFKAHTNVNWKDGSISGFATWNR
jgi:hypothetical protein